MDDNQKDQQEVEALGENEKDVYHDFDKLTRISTLAKTISWIFLGASVLVLVGDVIIIMQQVGHGRNVFEIVWVQFVSTLVPILWSGFFFLILQAVAEGIYVLLDIEDNTHRVAVLHEKQFEQG